MILALILIPLLAGILAFVMKGNIPRRCLLVGTALVYVVLTAGMIFSPPAPVLKGWLLLDDLGLIFLGITSGVFLMTSIYAVGYLKSEPQSSIRDEEEGVFFDNEPESVFVGCLLVFLGTMTLVCTARHMGLIWVGVEGTTLASAPLIYFHRHHRSLEATWKYLMICSVGIALSLLGNFLLAIANHKGGASALFLDALIGNGPALNPVWLKAAFVFLLIGYGTKMGLAPMHTWLPDAHSESPSVVSALLSGALLNCAALALMRSLQICLAANMGEFARSLLVIFGFISIAIAVVFIFSQSDYKRMLAYSSVEHMGIVALGLGLGGFAVAGALFHAINHSLVKSSLFLTSGNILSAYRTKLYGSVHGIIKRLPLTGILWMTGFLAITGMPPFGSFFSKWIILQTAVYQGQYVYAILFLGGVALIFAGMATIVIRMIQGNPPDTLGTLPRESAWRVWPPAILCTGSLVLGLWNPAPLQHLFHSASVLLGGL